MMELLAGVLIEIYPGHCQRLDKALLKGGKMKVFERFMTKLGYFCLGCNRYKKVFAPPYGRKVCLSCQLEDVSEHQAYMKDLELRQQIGILSKDDLLTRLDYLRDRFLQSKAERNRSE